MCSKVKYTIAAIAGLLSVSAHAQDALSVNETPWQDHQGMLATRIVTVSPEAAAAAKGKLHNKANTVLLAWEAKLEDGWKTYWRSPGEAGLPVRIYENGAEADIYYPVPERFELFGLETYGYSKSVMLPFEVAAQDGEVSLSADFMVCKEICVPFRQEYKMILDKETVGNIVFDTRVKPWLAKLPYIDGNAPQGLSITKVKVSGKPGFQKLIVEATAEQPLTHADLLAELDEATQFHAPASRIMPDGQSIQFVLPTMTAQKNRNLAGEKVRLTLVDGRGHAVEQFFELPAR